MSEIQCQAHSAKEGQREETTHSGRSSFNAGNDLTRESW